MRIEDFDRWRHEYGQLSYREQQAFYNQMALEHPLQQHFDADAFERFFRFVDEREDMKIGVLEVGGWKGELARLMLAKVPGIAAWVNYEISEQAVKETVCEDDRYDVVVPDDFVWNVSLYPGTACVMSHLVEHLRMDDLVRLITNLPASIRYLALDAPLPDAGPANWQGYYGSHILESGWSEVRSMLGDHGFRLIAELGGRNFRAFSRDGTGGSGKPTIGVAMVVRNGAETMRWALEPFKGVVDEVAIVLGGESSDETQMVAAEYATLPVWHYQGPLDKDGRLLDFGAARQLAMGLLISEWMVVVDADEVWEGVEHLPALLMDVTEKRIGMVQFPYRVGRGVFLRPLLIRRQSGRWRNPVHEYWELDKDWEVAQTDVIRVEHQKREGQERPGHNIALAETWLEEHPEDQRTRALLGRDYIDAGEYQKALETLNRYLAGPRDEDKEREFEAHYCRAAVFLRLERYADALQAAAMALTVQPNGMAWAVMGEAALWMAQATRAQALYELAAMCTDRALAIGRIRAAAWTSEEMVTTIPLLIKAQALAALKRNQEALAALDLALAMEPGNGEAERMRDGLCQVMGVLR